MDPLVVVALRLLRWRSLEAEDGSDTEDSGSTAGRSDTVVAADMVPAEGADSEEREGVSERWCVRAEEVVDERDE